MELLEEQKQAIIYRAVTGQIDVRTGQPYPAYEDFRGGVARGGAAALGRRIKSLAKPGQELCGDWIPSPT